jgi:sterol desaturase/sphingolipid hydroxylase (fatty acid hydroxylase superfamily)
MTHDQIVTEFYTNIALVLYALRWFAWSFIGFACFAMVFKSRNPQPIVRKQMSTDMVYWFYAPLLYRPVGLFMTLWVMALVYGSNTRQHLGEEGLPPLKDLPLWLQVLMIILITDFIQYWVHRWMHNSNLWKYHAVHHSSTTLDWLSAARFHPVNIFLYSIVVNVFVVMLGFSPKAFAILVPFNTIFSCFVHTNVDWTFGPLRHVFVSPVFHRWHHTHLHEGGNKNFAQTFSFMDKLFGTFYMPAGKLPTVFGAPDDPIPEHIFGQLAYPFRKPAAATPSGLPEQTASL